MSGRISEIETKTDFVDSDLKYMQEKPDRKKKRKTHKDQP